MLALTPLLISASFIYLFYRNTCGWVPVRTALKASKSIQVAAVPIQPASKMHRGYRPLLLVDLRQLFPSLHDGNLAKKN